MAALQAGQPAEVRQPLAFLLGHVVAVGQVRPCDRATEFKQRCDGLGIKGVTLHSYRYAWAERAKQCGYPERFAQEALGHNSKAVHRAYARNAQVVLPPLEEYERRMAKETTLRIFPVVKTRNEVVGLDDKSKLSQPKEKWGGVITTSSCEK
jgi:hypothetical protein